MSSGGAMHNVIICRTNIMSHILVHIGSHHGIGRVLTGSPKRVSLHAGIDVSV